MGGSLACRHISEGPITNATAHRHGS